jgi:hypothetical protein
MHMKYMGLGTLASRVSAKVMLLVDMCGSIACLLILLIYQSAKIKALLWFGSIKTDLIRLGFVQFFLEFLWLPFLPPRSLSHKNFK